MIDDYEESDTPTVKGKIRKHKHDKYIGVEISFPAHAETEEQLYEICKQLDVYHWRDLEVNHWALIESQVQGLITAGELSVLYWLCSQVQSWNVVFCNIKDLPCHEKKAYTFLKQLSPWSLRVIENNRGSLKISMSPFLVWKGDIHRREKHIKEWYVDARRMERN